MNKNNHLNSKLKYPSYWFGRLFFVSMILFIALNVHAQKTQNINGRVTDKSSKQALIGATVFVEGTTIASVTDENGAFLLENIPVGRVNIVCNYLGYEPTIAEGIIISTGRSDFVEIQLNQNSQIIADVLITGTKNAFEAVNPLSVVSSRSFTAEETDRIPAGINDPGRVALSFPGVKQGNDENENTIIVRGNAPIGILWRLEGIDIPNPNHFPLIGSATGGITIFSAQLLAKSDFSTGGMAAEYGNALSGAFDVQFRKGNTKSRNHRIKLGIIGLDISTEGPISKGKSSYLLNYRYSTLSLLNKAGFNLVGERVVNDFQDFSFNIGFKTINTKLSGTVFGIGGLSLEQYLPEYDLSKRNPTYFDHREFQDKPAKMGTIGTTWTYLGSDKYFIKGVVALIGSGIERKNDTIGLDNKHFRYHTESFTDTRLSTSLTFNYIPNAQWRIKSGLIFHQIFFDFFRDRLPVGGLNDINSFEVVAKVNGSGNTQTLQQYTQASWQASPRLSVNIGYHFLHLFANNSNAVDPRLSAQYSFSSRHKLSLAYGIHSQILPLMSYYFQDQRGQFTNKNLKLLQANHLVGAYHFYTENKMKISLEAYYQTLSNVPVSTNIKDKYWLLNQTNGYPLFEVKSNGKGTNMGIDVAVEKLFSNSYYFLATGSYLKSDFTPADGKIYRSRWSAGLTSSFTFGKEVKLGQNKTLQIGGRFLLSGGGRYTPYDPVLSQIAGSYIAKSEAEYAGQLPVYYRLDTRIQYRFNAKKYAGSISLDVQNAINRINASGIGYDAATNTTYIQYRGGGFVPVIAFQVDF
ncbi:MAG: TonB-dependent receptor [Saprospiraceae bacterium]